jgi:adenine-specific DNA-methyltransferase
VGRRWITCDTSRVAITLARQRLMTAVFDYYELAHPEEGVGSGFKYKTVPHVTLKSIANNPEIDGIHARLHPAVQKALAELNAALKRPSPTGLSYAHISAGASESEHPALLDVGESL